MISCFLLFLSFFPQTAGQECRASALGQMLKARFAVIVGDYQKALAMTDEAMTCDPMAADAAFLRVTILEDRERERLVPSNTQRELVSNLTEFMERFPSDYRFPHKLGVLMVKNPGWVAIHRLDDPKVYLDKALALSGEDPLNMDVADIWYHIGRWFMVNFQHFESALAFQKVCALDAESTWAWYYAGRALENSHQFRKALASYRQFNHLADDEPWNRKPAVSQNIALLELVLDPSDEKMVAYWDLLKEEGPTANSLYNAAVLLKKMRHYGRALELLEAISTDDRDFDFYLIYSRLHGEMGRHQAWLDKVLPLLETELPERARLLLVDSALDSAILSGSWSKILFLEEHYSNLQPMTARLQVYAALVSALELQDKTRWETLVARSANDPIIRFWQEMVENYGLDNAARRAILLLYIAREEWENAYQFYSQNLSIEEPGPLFEEDLATISSLSGHQELGFRLFDRLILENPDRFDLLNNYGYFLTVSNHNLEKARELLQRVVTNDGRSSANLDSMGWVLFKLGNYQEAESWLARALAISPDDPEQNEHMGDILQALNREDEARRYWSRAMEYTQSRYPELLQKLDPAP